MVFLKAKWNKLIMANYQIDPSILKPYIPYGTELDLFNGKCYLSLVAFMFENTKVLGVKVPFHIDFEEVNLRFYVRRKENNEWKRGVVFIKEIVPKYALSFVANTLYKEHYVTHKMKHNFVHREKNQTISYEWKVDGFWYKIAVNASSLATVIEEGSEEEFITEHYWGYAKVNNGKTNEYEVKHPRWEQYKLYDYSIDVDFAKVYGENFKLLNTQTPESVFLATGSNVCVEQTNKIKA